MSRFINNLNSDYIAAATHFRRKGDSRDVVMVYVEGYADIAFWRNVLYKYETSTLRFEINVPSRGDLAKGKKVLLTMRHGCGKNLILCMDSDFDYLFGDHTEQSQMVNNNKYIFQTYTYAIENYLCYPTTIRNACVMATKNDAFIFDFEYFMTQYSRTIYPLFLWYISSAYNKNENAFPLSDFKSSVKLHYLTIEHNGSGTIEWLSRQVERKKRHLQSHYPNWDNDIIAMEKMINAKGVNRDNIYLFMHGHTLFENVVSVLCKTVCEALKIMNINVIRDSSRRGVSLSNELSAYKNAQRDVMEILLDSNDYTDSDLFKRLKGDIDRYIDSFKETP